MIGKVIREVVTKAAREVCEICSKERMCKLYTIPYAPLVQWICKPCSTLKLSKDD